MRLEARSNRRHTSVPVAASTATRSPCSVPAYTRSVGLPFTVTPEAITGWVMVTAPRSNDHNWWSEAALSTPSVVSSGS
jgi:predicted permease